MTAQVHENLIYDGWKMTMAFCPPIPYHPRIEPCEEKYTSSACWRGYIGTWEIKNNLFYLVNLKKRYKIIGDDPIFADWFSGVIRIPSGEKLYYVHMGFGSVYEQEIHVKIERGKVVNSRVIDNRNKDIDTGELEWGNLPGSENRFEGDDKL